MTDRRCAGGCCDNRPGWEWVEDPVTHAREKRRQTPQPGQHGTEGHECQPRMAQDGAYLCRPCEHHLRDLVRGMPSYALDLERAATHSGQRQRVKTGDESPDFASQRGRWEALGQLAHDVQWWMGHVADTRGLRQPTASTNTRHLISTCCAWLTPHTGWLASRDDAGDTLSAWRQMRGDAARAMDLPRDRARFPVGPCPETDCQGTVVAFIGTEKNDSAMGCDTDETHQWAANQFLRAGGRIKRKMDGAA